MTLSDALRCNIPFVTSGELQVGSCPSHTHACVYSNDGITPSQMQSVHRIGDGIAKHIGVADVVVAVTKDDFVDKALRVATNTSLCRRNFSAAAYSVCTATPTDEVHPTGTAGYCDLRRRLCMGKSEIGMFSNEPLGTNSSCEVSAATMEWSVFLQNICVYAHHNVNM